MNQRPAPSWPGWGLLILLSAVALLPSLSSLALPDRHREVKFNGHGEFFEPARDFGFVNPVLHQRPEGLSPLTGASFDHDIRKLSDPDTLYTSTGVFHVSDPDNQRGLPPELREPATVAARGTGLKPGALNYALLSEKGRRQAGDVESRIAELGGRVVGLVRGGYLMWVPAQGIGELRKSDLFRAFSPMPRAHKIFPDVGVRPLIQKSRAEAPVLRLLVEVVSGVGRPEMVEKRLLAQADSVREVAEHFGLITYQVETGPGRVRKLAALPWVFSIREEYEWLTRNYETVPTLQVGSWEDRQFETPFWSAGLDGTGQVVAIADNGVSLDSPQLSHTPTDPGTVIQINFNVPEPHRKFVAFEALADELSCDSPASGFGTHGNVIAGLIAGNAAKDFGLLASYQPNRTEILSGVNLDGLARGARLVFQDIGNATTQCTLDELVEAGGNVTVPGNDLIALMSSAYDKGARLHVFPFAVPNMDSNQFANCLTNAPCTGAVSSGTYAAESRQIDTFLANHLDSMVFLPASNNGGEYPRPLGRLRNEVPDLFDSDPCNNNVDPTLPGYEGCPAVIPPATDPVPLMIDPPATAKNDITVGAGRADEGTLFGTFNGEENIENFTSKGPETAASLRMGPMIVTAGTDDSDVFGGPNTWGLAVLSSMDNDQDPPVQGPDAGRHLTLDDGNSGTSYAAATATAMGAIIRQYFVDGFYPSAQADPAHAIPTISGALVKAMLVMMTNYMDVSGITAKGMLDAETSSNRCGTFLGGTLGVGGNNEQGCGRPILAQGLPLTNYPDTNVYPLIGPGTPEQPAGGLVIYDFVATGEAVFTAADAAGGGRTKALEVFKPGGQLRCALAWIDPPDAGTGGVLINNLDLELVSPTGVSYHGNVYDGAWSVPDPEATAFDDKNPHEAIHIDQPEVGTWSVNITGAAPLGNSGPNEDADDDFQLDSGEDLDGDGILDLGGQPFALACSGPILTPSQGLLGGGSHPGTGNLVRWDNSQYGCREDVRFTLFDNSIPEPSEVGVTEAVIVEVRDSGGSLVETELVAMSLVGGGTFLSDLLPLKEEASPVAGNGVLEVEDGFRIEVHYADSDAAEGMAVAPIHCKPNLLASKFSLAGESDLQGVVSSGCDNDQHLDAGEVVTFSAAICNESNRDRYTEMTATLAVTGGPAAAMVEVIESEVRIGNLPEGSGCGVPPFGSGFQGISFSLRVDPAAQTLVDTDEANGWVELTLSLQAANQDRKLETETFIFRQAVVADREFFKYSTSFPDGTAGMEVERDLDRDGVISTDADTDNVPDILDDAIDAVEERIVFDPIPRIDQECASGSLNQGDTCSQDTDCHPAANCDAGDLNGGVACIDLTGGTDCHATAGCDPGDRNGGAPCVTLGGSPECHATAHCDITTATECFTPGVQDVCPLAETCIGDGNGTCIGNGDGTCLGNGAGICLTANTCTEDADGDGILDPGEDIGLDGVAGTGDTGEGNGALDRCIYGDPDGTSGTPDDLIPWSFDQNDGGFAVERDPTTESGIPALGKAWENVRSGACGFQTAIADSDPSPGFQNLGAGAWKTGDGLTPDTDGDGQISPEEASAYNDLLCHNYSIPVDPDTVPGAEVLIDVLESAIITRVHQSLDVRGFPFTTEFRRLGFNINAQISDDSTRLIVDLDGNIDEPNQNVLVAENDRYSEDRAPHDLFQFYGPLDPTDNTDPQDTFGPVVDPDGSLGEDVGCDNMSSTGDFGEQNGQLDTEDLGCNHSLDGPTDPLEGNGVLDTEDSSGDGILQPAEDIGCDRIVANCAAGQPGEDANFDFQLAVTGLCDPSAIRVDGVAGDPNAAQVSCVDATPCEMGLCDAANLNGGSICRAHVECDLQFPGDASGTCISQGPGTLSCLGYEDVGCDGIQATCLPAQPGEPPGSGVVIEVEPNDCIGAVVGCEGEVSPDFGAQRAEVPFTVNGFVSVGDPGGYDIGGDVIEDNVVFEFTGPGDVTFSATLSFDATDPAGFESDLDFFLFDAAAGILDAGATAANPETLGPITLSPGTYFLAVSAWDDQGNVGVAYTLQAQIAEGDAGCDGIPATCSTGGGSPCSSDGDCGSGTCENLDANGSEGNGRVDLPPDAGEADGILDLPPDPGEGDLLLTDEDVGCDRLPGTADFGEGDGFLNTEDFNGDFSLDPVSGGGVLTGDEVGFSGFTENAPGFLIPAGSLAGVDAPGRFPFPEYPAGTLAGPVRNTEADIVGYEDSDAVEGILHPGLSFVPGPAGNRFRIGWEWRVREITAQTTDFGVALDDVVFEWQEFHPGPEVTPACDKFNDPHASHNLARECAVGDLNAGTDCTSGTPCHASATCDEPPNDPCAVPGGPCGVSGTCVGNGDGICQFVDPRAPFYPAGSQCASLSVDRNVLYECEESLQITVQDPTPGTNLGDRNGNGIPDVEVLVSSDSEPVDSTSVGSGTQVILDEVSPGVYIGNAIVSQRFNSPTTIFVTPGTEASLSVFYADPDCDLDGDQAIGETDIDDIDGDTIPNNLDNCPNLPNLGQEDQDSDGLGDLCDNCPDIANSGQVDSDADGIGDAPLGDPGSCDADDLDGDGFANPDDNCPTLFNPDQTDTDGDGIGDDCDGEDPVLDDLDGDGIANAFDNCPATPNPGQDDSDGDGIGDQCDPDGPSTTDDDFDGDEVTDSADNCPTLSNPIPPGAQVQVDEDGDGRGDRDPGPDGIYFTADDGTACDPPGGSDDDSNGLPDDLILFGIATGCESAAGSISLVSTSIGDVNCLGKDFLLGTADDECDGDIFADSGETVRLQVTVINNGPGDLTNVTLGLSTNDPDITCITDSTAFLAEMPVDLEVTTIQDDFAFIVSEQANTVSFANPLRGDFTLTLISDQALGTRQKISISLPLDLDVVGAIPDKIAGPDGVKGTPDDGTLRESFEGPHGDTTRPTPGADGILGTPDDGTIDALSLSNTIGFLQSGDQEIPVVVCPDFRDLGSDPGCQIDPKRFNDWHIHAAETEIRPDVPYQTPTGGEQAFDGTTSLHWGRHLNPSPTDTTLTDTIGLRQIAAFVTHPVNLTVSPQAGDLILSFHQIIRLMDNNTVNFPGNFGSDRGQLQVAVDQDPIPPEDLNGNGALDPGEDLNGNGILDLNDSFGEWQLLVPFQGGYDKTTCPGPCFTGAYCIFSPADAVDDLVLCNPTPSFFSQGNQTGPADPTFDAQGPISPGATGPGQWVLSETNLADFIGQRVRIRWIGSTWELFATGWDSYLEFPEGGTPFQTEDSDDGWWIDDIEITGVIENPAPLTEDVTNAFNATFGCTEDLNGNGTLDPGEDTNGNGIIDPLLLRTETGRVALELKPSDTIVAGTLITANGGGSVLACVNSSIQFRFSRNGVVVRNWSGNPRFQDAPTADSLYRVEIRCAPVSVGDPDLLAQESLPVAFAEQFLNVTTGGIGELPQAPRILLELPSPTVTDIFFNPTGIGQQSGAAGVDRYEVIRLDADEDGRFPLTGLGDPDYSLFVPIGGDKYTVSGTALPIVGNPKLLCDDPTLAGDDRIQDNLAGSDTLDLPCFTDPSLPCFTDTDSPVDLDPPQNIPRGYFYVVISANGNGNNRFPNPGTQSRPESLNPVPACP